MRKPGLVGAEAAGEAAGREKTGQTAGGGFVLAAFGSFNKVLLLYPLSTPGRNPCLRGACPSVESDTEHDVKYRPRRVLVPAQLGTGTPVVSAHCSQTVWERESLRSRGELGALNETAGR